MSELTQCNFCNMQDIKRSAKENNEKIVTAPGDFGMGGIKIYVYPKDVLWQDVKDEEKEQYFAVWFMEIPDHCCC